MSAQPTSGDVELDEMVLRLAAFADTLIPGGAGLPSASEAGVHAGLIERALAARPDLEDVVMTVIDSDGEPAEELERLRVEQPTLFDNFTFAISGAYFLSPEVRRLLGYPGPAPEPKPAAPGEAEQFLAGDIIEQVIARGPIFRPTPDPDITLHPEERA
jgi:hypothetical protein